MRQLQTDLSILHRFAFEYAPVGVKFMFKRPEGMELLDTPAAMCELVGVTQRRGTPSVNP
jgi:hypothetical protein